MQGLFNRQQSFITSLFSKGRFSTKHIVTVCCRRVVTSSRCALHHGKGVTFKIQGGKGPGYGHNIHSPRIARGPANSKSYKTSSWLKKSKSGKSSGSTCTVTKNRKGKIIFRVTRQSLPKVILEECTEKPSSTFRNSINKVFESKLVRTRKSKQGLNDCLLADAKQPVDKLSLPQFKDTSVVNVGHRKTFKNSSFVNVMKKSRSAETHIVIQQNQGVVRSIVNNSTVNENYFSSNPELSTKIESYSKKSHVGGNTLVGVKDKNNRPDRACTVSKANKNAPSLSSTCKKPKKARSKPLIFSSSEMLFSNADSSNNVGVDKMKKLGNSCREHELCKPDAKQVKDVAHSDSLLVENPSIEPLEENIDSTIKLFMGRDNNSVPARKEHRLSDTVKNLVKLENNEEALNLECIGQRSLQASILDKRIGDYVSGVSDTKTEFRKVENYHSGTDKSDGLNQSLLSEVASGDKSDSVTKAPLKSSQNRSMADRRSVTNTTTPNVQTLKKSDNITIHRHMDLKRKTNEERVEFDTTVIEQEGKKITKIKPKHDSNLRRKSSYRSLAVKKRNGYLDDVRNSDKVKTPNKSFRSTKIESSTLAKTKERTLDKVVVPENGEEKTLAEIDPFIPKMKLQTLNSRKVVIPGDGRTIKEGECDWCMKENKHGQDRDSGKQSLKSEGLIIPQDGNTIHPWETETDSFISRSESLSNKNNYTRKSSSNINASRNDVKNHYQPGDVHMYGSQSPVKSEDVLFDDSPTQTRGKVMSYGQLRDTSTKQTGDNPSMLSNSLGINQHVFIQNNPNSKGAMQPDHRSSTKEAVELQKESEFAKTTPETVVSNGVPEPEVAASLTKKIGANTIMSRTAVMNKEVEPEPIGLNQVTQIMSDSSVLRQKVTSPSEDKSWRSLLPLYSTKKSNDPEKTLDKKEPLYSSFADSFTTASESTGISSLRDGNSHWSRKVTKIKFSPQNALEPSQTQTSSMSIPPSNKGMQLSAGPKINVTSETATAVVLKSRLAQSPPESIRLNSPQTQSRPNGFSQVYSGIATTNNSYKYPEVSIISRNAGLMATDGLNIPVNAMARDSQLGVMPNEGVENIPPSSSVAFGVQTAGPQSLSNKANSSLMNPGISTANNAFPSNVSCNMPKASFPPPCNACHTNPIMLCGNQVSCSADGCNTKSVFPPPCDACETPNVRHQPEQKDCLSCPTCKPEFPPPCPSNPCSSTTQRPENSCYDPCNPVTKSRTHTVMDIENLPRPPVPICIDCVPKSKPCFPPQCPEQCKNTSNTCCQQMHKTKTRHISFAGWRAYMNYTYWSMKCLFTGIFESFLTLLKARIMHVCEYKTKKSCQKQIHPSQECKVMQSSVIRPKKAAGLGISGINRNHKHVNSLLQQKFKPTIKNKVRKNVRIVKSVKKSVLDDRSKRAILVEEEKRKSVGAKTNPALAYSEVLNIVFSQKKSV